MLVRVAPAHRKPRPVKLARVPGLAHAPATVAPARVTTHLRTALQANTMLPRSTAGAQYALQFAVRHPPGRMRARSAPACRTTTPVPIQQKTRLTASRSFAQCG